MVKKDISVTQIQELLRKGLSQGEVARKFKVSRATICRILKRYRDGELVAKQDSGSGCRFVLGGPEPKVTELDLVKQRHEDLRAKVKLLELKLQVLAKDLQVMEFRLNEVAYHTRSHGIVDGSTKQQHQANPANTSTSDPSSLQYPGLVFF